METKLFDVNFAPSTTLTPEPKPKKDRTPQRVSADARLRQAEKQMAAARAAARRVEQNRAQIVGEVVIKAMGEDATFKKEVVDFLKRHVVSQSKLVEISDLLTE